MTYGLSTTLDRPFDDTVTAVREALAGEGFGVVSEIDMQATLRTKLGVETSSSGPATPPTPTARCRPIRRSVCCCPATWSSAAQTPAPS
jgi:hypothetical protein